MNKYEQIEDINERRAAFLNDTIAHFNSSNRAWKEDPFCIKCWYSHSVNGGCAIGRHIDEARAIELDELAEGGIGEVIAAEPDSIPEWMKEMGIDFLSDAQALHDESSNWDSSGLSAFGMAKAGDIRTEFDLHQ